MARRNQGAAWRSKAWTYVAYGTPEDPIVSPAISQCPTPLVGNTQVFLPVCISEMFGPADSMSPQTLPGSQTLQQEKILVKRTLGHVELKTLISQQVDPVSLPATLRAVLVRLDEGGVWDPTHIYPSLYGNGFHADERILLTLSPKYDYSAQFVVDATEVVPISVVVAHFEWDQALNTKVETGNTLWLMIEQAICESQTTNYNVAWNYIGWSRTLFIE